MTGLPFVFAVWLSNKAQEESKMKLFNDAIEKGLSMISDVVSRMDYKHYDLNHYYHQNINYVLDEKKRAAIDKYLSYLKEG
jgi:chorismate dehydratase